MVVLSLKRTNEIMALPTALSKENHLAKVTATMPLKGKEIRKGSVGG